MAKRVRPPALPDGSLAFTELASSDPSESRKFLEAVFGWTFRKVEMPMGDYLSYEAPGSQGGIRPVRSGEPPSSLSYVRVHDLDAAARRIRQRGGRIVLPRVDVPGMGSFLWFRIPGGPILACWQDLPATPITNGETP